MNERLLIFNLIIIALAVAGGLIIRKKREKRIKESIAADTTEKQAQEIINKVLPNGSFKAVPAAMKLTAGQNAAVLGKDFAKSMAASLLTGRKVHYHSNEDEADDNFMLAYSSNDLYLISIEKDYKGLTIKMDDSVPLHLCEENVEKFTYKPRNATATVFLKDGKTKFALEPKLAFFDKGNQDRLVDCKEFLTSFAQRFNN